MSKNNQSHIIKQLDALNFYKELAKYSKNPTFTTLLSIIFAILLVIFAIKPSFGKIDELKQQIQHLENLDSKLSTKLSTLKKLEPQYQQALQKKSQLYACLPESPQVETFERQIRYYIQKHDIPFKSLSISAFPVIDPENQNFLDVISKNQRTSRAKKTSEIVSQLSHFTGLNYSVSLEGDYNQIKNILFDFQKNIRASDFNTISIVSSQDGNLRLSLSGTIYYYKDKIL